MAYLSARCFGASRKQIFFKLSLPSAAPFVLAGLKLGIGRGLIGKQVGDVATVVTPNGKREMEVLKLVTIHDEAAAAAASEEGK